ncbi:MAG: HD-GYP domain-containing protein [Anaeromyxobacteraceae bacterium]
MFDRVTLRSDLLDARGAPVARRGAVISVAAVLAAARGTRPDARTRRADSDHARDARAVLADATYRHVFRPAALPAVERALLAIALPDVLFAELAALAMADPARHRHALTTAAVAARMLVSVVGDAPALPDVAAAALLHDVGMRHAALHLADNGDDLAPQEILDVASHPLVGARLLAAALGAHPAVEAALSHHWRCGHGYPALPRPPSRSVEVIAVASAFAALTQPRAYRSAPYDARGAVDVLLAEAEARRADPGTVRLLVHALRGGEGPVREQRFGRRLPDEPAVNRHSRVAPTRSAM